MSNKCDWLKNFSLCAGVCPFISHISPKAEGTDTKRWNVQKPAGGSVILSGEVTFGFN